MTNLPYEGAIITRNTDNDGTMIATYTGRTINPLKPEADAIHIGDIAHSLALQCRFTGHTKKFYSVAQHSVLCSENIDPEFALVALLHDASEAYLSDVARPIKSQAEFGDTYKKYELALEEVIAEAFELPFPWPAEVKAIDNVLLRTEQRDLMPAVYRHEGTEYLEGEITPWSPETSELRFLERYAELTSAKVDYLV